MDLSATPSSSPPMNEADLDFLAKLTHRREFAVVAGAFYPKRSCVINGGVKLVNRASIIHSKGLGLDIS